MVAVLTVEKLTKFYGSLKALNEVTFQVPQGAVFGLLGPNGSGKTTLLSILLDVLKASRGSFNWFGQPNAAAQRKSIGSLLETPNFYPYLSAVDNLKITQHISGRGNLGEIDSILKKVNLYERRHSPFHTYSLGMKQRLAIAAALMGTPKVLILDEPTNGLDPLGIAEIRRLILELKNNQHTIILASHLLDEVEKVCTHVAILKGGTLMAAGAVADILTNEDVVEVSAHDLAALAQVLKQLPDISSLKIEADKIWLTFASGVTSPEAINRFCFEKGITLGSLSLQARRLETCFIELTRDKINT